MANFLLTRRVGSVVFVLVLRTRLRTGVCFARISRVRIGERR